MTNQPAAEPDGAAAAAPAAAAPAPGDDTRPSMDLMQQGEAATPQSAARGPSSVGAWDSSRRPRSQDEPDQPSITPIDDAAPAEESAKEPSGVGEPEPSPPPHLLEGGEGGGLADAMQAVVSPRTGTGTSRVAPPPPKQLAPASPARDAMNENHFPGVLLALDVASALSPNRAGPGAGAGGGGAKRRSPSATVSRRPLPESSPRPLNVDHRPGVLVPLPSAAAPTAAPAAAAPEPLEAAAAYGPGQLVHVDERVGADLASVTGSQSVGFESAVEETDPSECARARHARQFSLCLTRLLRRRRVDVPTIGRTAHQAPRLHAARL